MWSSWLIWEQGPGGPEVWLNCSIMKATVFDDDLAMKEPTNDGLGAELLGRTEVTLRISMPSSEGVAKGRNEGTRARLIAT